MLSYQLTTVQTLTFCSRTVMSWIRILPKFAHPLYFFFLIRLFGTSIHVNIAFAFYFALQNITRLL